MIMEGDAMRFKAIKISTKDPRERFLMSSASFSTIGTSTFIKHLTKYVDRVDTHATNMAKGASMRDGNDLSALYHASMIKDASVEAIYYVDLLRASLDRFVCPEDAEIPQEEHVCPAEQPKKEKKKRRKKDVRDTNR
jgi:hypothetical protein